jgi:pyrroline-5-carboxylate reductase
MINEFLGFIGTGNMQSAIIRGILDAKVARPDQVIASDRTIEKLNLFAKQTGIRKAQSNADVVQNSQVIFLGTKPGDLAYVLHEIKTAVQSHHIIVSIAAGFPLNLLKSYLPQAKAHVRLMPNTPCMVQAGVVGFLMSPYSAHVERILNEMITPIGQMVAVKDDHGIDAITASASSGSGFAFKIMESFEAWLIARGFSKEVARSVTIETFLGASVLAQKEHDKSLAELRVAVTSPKGTTEAGLSSMDKAGLDQILKATLNAAFERAQEISRNQSLSFAP